MTRRTLNLSARSAPTLIIGFSIAWYSGSDQSTLMIEPGLVPREKDVANVICDDGKTKEAGYEEAKRLTMAMNEIFKGIPHGGDCTPARQFSMG